MPIEITVELRYNIITGMEKGGAFPMDGLTNVIAAASMSLSQTNLASQASIAMLKNAMNMDESASAKIFESISQAAPSADGCGALMDVRA